MPGSGNYPFPDGMLPSIPGIAWKMANIEAYARIELESKGEIVACLQATLTNGWTTENTGVKWGTGAFSLAAVLLATIHSIFFRSSSSALYRWFDVLYLYQSAAAAGLMHLNYPLVYTAFVRNFAWSFGLFPNDTVQNTINTLRHRTGGKMPFSAFQLVQYINTKFSPYNELPAHKRALLPALLNSEDKDMLSIGIPVIVNSIGIPLANALSTVFFWFLACFAILTAFHALLGLLVFVLTSKNAVHGQKGPNWAINLRRTWWQFCANNALRVCLAWVLPIVLFACYQWVIGNRDSGLSVFWAVLGVVLVVGPLLAAFIWTVHRNRQPAISDISVPRLWSDYRIFHAAGYLYRPFKSRYHFFWFAPCMLGTIIKACFIGLGPGSPWVQVIGCLAVEFIILVLLIVLRPFKKVWDNILSILLALLRMIVFGCPIAFLESLHIQAIPRTAIGIGMIVVTGIATILLLLDFLWNIGATFLISKSRRNDYLDLESPYDDELSSKRPLRDVGELRSSLLTTAESASYKEYKDPYDPYYGHSRSLSAKDPYDSYYGHSRALSSIGENFISPAATRASIIPPGVPPARQSEWLDNLYSSELYEPHTPNHIPSNRGYAL